MASKQLGWEVREVEVPGRASWHTSPQANHGHSQSFNRYLFDLELLERDRNDMPDDPHVLYYLGVRSSFATAALGKLFTFGILFRRCLHSLSFFSRSLALLNNPWVHGRPPILQP